MAFPAFNKDTFRTAALGLGLLAMTATAGTSLAPKAHAEDVGYQTANFEQPAEITILTDEQLARLTIESKAMEFAAAGHANLGISVLEGPDLYEIMQSDGTEFANRIQTSIKEKHGVSGAVYAGDNGNKITEVTLFYQTMDTNNNPVVITDGPHNLLEATPALLKAVEHVRNVRDYSALQVSYEN